ncbi:putative asparagine synthetase [Organic Lake phycodnavirus 1]|nr:putative asparagine synthetase [Organic Lake phycodnavirus 1]
MYHIIYRSPIEFRKGSTEKEFIRYAIQQTASDLLPYSILWRKKEAFSDGVSSLQKPWFKMIQDTLVDYNNTTEELTNEQCYYRDLFVQYFGNHTNIIPYYWMPKFVDTNDPSARTLTHYSSINEYFYRMKYFLTDMFMYRFRQLIF